MIGTPQNRWRETHQPVAFRSFVHAVFAPSRNPFDAVDFFEGFLAQGFLFSVSAWFHFDEPLLRLRENHRVVAAPAVRITVLVSWLREERAAVAEQFSR